MALWLDRIIVLSNTFKRPPDNLKDKVEMYSSDLIALITKLENEGYKHAYIDGGSTIQEFINLQFINEITMIPILLGEGKPLFGKVEQDVILENAKAVACPSDYVQIKYTVSY